MEALECSLHNMILYAISSMSLQNTLALGLEETSHNKMQQAAFERKRLLPKNLNEPRYSIYLSEIPGSSLLMSEFQI